MVLTDELLKDIGLINSFPFSALYLTVVTPVWFGSTTISILSPFSKLWDVDTATVDVIFCVFAVTWSKLLSSRYSLSFEPLYTNNTPSVVDARSLWVASPIKSFDLLITYSVCVLPNNGRLNCAPPEVLDTVRARPGPGFVKVTCWLFLNGWFGKNILWDGTSTVVVTTPTWKLTVVPIPTFVLTPTDSTGLKNTLSFTFDSK